MDAKLKDAIMRAVKEEPLARQFNMELVELETGRSVVEMTYDPSRMNNLYKRAHGGALYALIDEAFETASNSHGTMAVALNMTVTYLAAPSPGSRLTAEAREFSRTRKTANYDIKVHDHGNRLIASCQALVYRKGTPLPFLKED